MRLVVIGLMVVVSSLGFAKETDGEANELVRAAVSTPKPEYPYAARLHRIQGSGSFLVRLHTPTGRIKAVIAETSTGSPILDQAAIAGLKKWRFKPGIVAPMSKHAPGFKDRFANEDRLFRVPITFTMNRSHRTGTFVVRQPL